MGRRHRNGPSGQPDLGLRPGDESVMAFTDFGIETLTGLIQIYKADSQLLKRARPTR